MKKLLLLAMVCVGVRGATNINTNVVLGVHPSLLTDYVRAYVSNYFATNIVNVVSNYNATNGFSTNAGGVLQKTPVAYWLLRDLKAQNSAGGTGSSGAWTTRVINTLDSASSTTYTNHVTLSSSNTFYLTAGTYIIDADAPSWGAGIHRARLFNVTSSNVVVYGTSSYSAAGGSDSDTTESRINTVLTVSTNTQFRVDHYIGASNGSQDFGVPSNIAGVGESYTAVKITKLAN